MLIGCVAAKNGVSPLRNDHQSSEALKTHDQFVKTAAEFSRNRQGKVGGSREKEQIHASNGFTAIKNVEELEKGEGERASGTGTRAHKKHN